VADGAEEVVGASLISVGVGTGGRVSDGSVGSDGARDGADVMATLGTAALVTGVATALGGIESPGRGRAEYCTGVAGCRRARSGAEPIPPAP
jgi:hypothetical protein